MSGLGSRVHRLRLMVGSQQSWEALYAKGATAIEPVPALVTPFTMMFAPVGLAPRLTDELFWN